MKNTTLCYIRRGSEYLLLHRVKKHQDPNQGKWVGVGGKFEDRESPDECLVREVWEETGLTLTRWTCRGVVTFVSDEWPTEYMHLFTGDAFEGELAADCDEGVLAWVDKADIPALPQWEGDRVFLQLIAEEEPFFLLKLVYRGDALVQAVLNGRELAL